MQDALVLGQVDEELAAAAAAALSAIGVADVEVERELAQLEHLAHHLARPPLDEARPAVRVDRAHVHRREPHAQRARLARVHAVLVPHMQVVHGQLHIVHDARHKRRARRRLGRLIGRLLAGTAHCGA